MMGKGFKLGLMAAGLLAGNALSVSYTFQNVTGDGPDIGNQLSVNVSDAGGGRVLFTFGNQGPISSTITEIYFDDGTLLGIAAIQNSGGVNFDQGGAQGVNPANLPGAETLLPRFEANGAFSTQASGNKTTGIDSGETLGILFDLINGKSYADTLTALNDGSLKIGLHVRSIGDSGVSDSYVTPGTSRFGVPDSATTLFLLGLSLAGIEALRRRLQK